jgi:hypothetical protein
MKKYLNLIVLLLLIVTFSSFAQESVQTNPRVYKINRYGGQDADLFLKTITIDQNQSIFDFSLEGGGWAKLYKKGSSGAMWVKGKISNKRYEILDASGISWAPEKTKFKGNLKFKVIFERIDDVDTVVDVIEGDEKFEGDSFTIRNIELK